MNMLLPLLMHTFGCTNSGRDTVRTEPTFIEVSMQGEVTNEESIPYSNTVRTITVQGNTLDRNAEPYSYDGWIEVTAKPGDVRGVTGAEAFEDAWGDTHWYVKAEDGQVEVSVDLASAFGDTRVWLTAVGDPNTPGAPGSMATGVTEAAPIAYPTIPDLQDVTHLDIDDLGVALSLALGAGGRRPVRNRA